MISLMTMLQHQSLYKNLWAMKLNSINSVVLNQILYKRVQILWNIKCSNFVVSDQFFSLELICQTGEIPTLNFPNKYLKNYN